MVTQNTLNQVPGLAGLAREQLRSPAVVLKLFGFSVPGQLLPDLESDITQVCDRGRAMAGLDVSSRLIPRTHAVDEICRVQFRGIGCVHLLALERTIGF